MLHTLARLNILSLAFALLPSIGSPAVAADTSGGRPNIIIMMADDMGYSDLGCFGAEIETPHLDSLAKNGLRFSQFYNTGRCCPTRAALLTGLYQHQAGVGHMVGNDKLPGYEGKLNDRCVTLADVLKPAGYATLMVGKWHVGSDKGHWPVDRGFEKYFGTPSGGGVYFKETLSLRPQVFFVEGNEKTDWPDGAYVTDLFADHAIRFVKDATRSDKPFFLYFAHIAPHWPLQAKPADMAKYKGRYDAGYDALREARHAKQIELGVMNKDWKLAGRPPGMKPWKELDEATQKDLSLRMEIYAAQIDSIDQNVGRLLAALKETNKLDNTVFIFLSDNGCSAEGGPGGFSRGKKDAPLGTGLSYASAGLEWATACNTPLRKHKMSVHEGGISSPFIVHWPAGLTRKGEIETQPGHVMDLMPTCVELAKAKYPGEVNGKKIQPMEGVSLVPALSGKPLGRAGALCWEHEGNQAIREGDWKLVRANGGEWELYNLLDDRTEQNNLFNKYSFRVTEMKATYEAWMKRANVEPWSAVKKKP
ncbi:MAG: arylsulfatase [Phycisphaeraceae bacterium]